MCNCDVIPNSQLTSIVAGADGTQGPQGVQGVQGDTGPLPTIEWVEGDCTSITVKTGTVANQGYDLRVTIGKKPVNEWAEVPFVSAGSLQASNINVGSSPTNVEDAQYRAGCSYQDNATTPNTFLEITFKGVLGVNFVDLTTRVLVAQMTERPNSKHSFVVPMVGDAGAISMAKVDIESDGFVYATPLVSLPADASWGHYIDLTSIRYESPV